MPGECLPDDVQILWREMEMSSLTFSPDQLRREMEKLQVGSRRKSIIVAVVGWSLIAAFAVFFFLFDNTLARIGSALSVAGFAYMLVYMRRAKWRALPDVGPTECIRFYRTELERHRDSCRGMRLWSWILIVMAPWIIFNLGFMQVHPEVAPVLWFDCGFIVAAAAFVAHKWLSTARRYQDRIDMLDASQKGS
jgi:hypothetical protein